MKLRIFSWALLVSLLAGAGLIAQTGTQPRSVSLRLIVVATPDEARRVLDRLTRGESFSAVARSVSIDPSAADGGLLGRIELTTLRVEVRSAVEGLRVGQVSPVAQVATGFAVLQVVPDLPGSRAAINPASLAAISAVGSVKFVPDIGGLPEAEALLRDFPKPDTWSQDPRTICQVRQDSLSTGQQLFENFFAPANAAIRKGRPAFEMLQAHLGLAQLLAYQGSMTRAVEQYEQAYQIALTEVSAAEPQVGEMLGVAYLHKAGMDSGIFRQAGDLCLLPPSPGRAYAKTADVERAVAQFAKYLERRPDDVEVRWLLNLGYMALGTWPDSVPERFRIPASVLRVSRRRGSFS